MIITTGFPEVVSLGKTAFDIRFEQLSKQSIIMTFKDYNGKSIYYEVINETEKENNKYKVIFTITDTITNGIAKFRCFDSKGKSLYDKTFIISKTDINNSKLSFESKPEISSREIDEIHYEQTKNTVINENNEVINDISIYDYNTITKLTSPNILEYNISDNLLNKNITVQNIDYDIPTKLQSITLSRNILQKDHEGQVIELEKEIGTDIYNNPRTSTIYSIANNFNDTTSYTSIIKKKPSKKQSMSFMLNDLIDSNSVVIENSFYPYKDPTEKVGGDILKLTKDGDTLIIDFMGYYYMEDSDGIALNFDSQNPLVVLISQNWNGENFEYYLTINQLKENIEGYLTDVTTIYSDYQNFDTEYSIEPVYPDFDQRTDSVLFDPVNDTEFIFTGEGASSENYLLSEIIFWKNMQVEDFQNVINLLTKPYTFPENIQNYKSYTDIYDWNFNFTDKKIESKNIIDSKYYSYNKMSYSSCESPIILKISDQNNAGSYFDNFEDFSGSGSTFRYNTNGIEYDFDDMYYNDYQIYNLKTKIYKVLNSNTCIISDIFKDKNDVAILDGNITIKYTLISYENSNPINSKKLIFDVKNTKTISNNINKIKILYRIDKRNYITLNELDVINENKLQQHGTFKDNTIFANNWTVETNTSITYSIGDEFKLKNDGSTLPELLTNQYYIISNDLLYYDTNAKYSIKYSVDSLNINTQDNYVILGIIDTNGIKHLISIQQLNDNKIQTYESNNIDFYVDVSGNYKIFMQLVGDIKLYDIEISNTKNKITPYRLYPEISLFNYPEIRDKTVDFKLIFYGENDSNYSVEYNDIYVSKIATSYRGGDESTQNFLIFDSYNEGNIAINEALNIYAGINVYLIIEDRQCYIKYDEDKGTFYLERIPKTREQYEEIYPVVAGDMWLRQDVPVADIESNIIYTDFEILELIGDFAIGIGIDVTLESEPNNHELWKYRPLTDTWIEITTTLTSTLLEFDIIDENIYEESYLYVLLWN